MQAKPRPVEAAPSVPPSDAHLPNNASPRHTPHPHAKGSTPKPFQTLNPKVYTLNPKLLHAIHIFHRFSHRQVNSWADFAHLFTEGRLDVYTLVPIFWALYNAIPPTLFFVYFFTKVGSKGGSWMLTDMFGL